MTTQALPFKDEFDLSDIGRNGADVTVTAAGEDLTRIAQWAGVQAVESFRAAITLRKHSASGFSLDADLTADIVQECVVTLEPVRSHIVRPVHRELHLTAPSRHRDAASIPLTALAGEEDVPEEIENLHYDLAAPLLEELVLAIDPYPRAPGVEFAAPAEPANRPENPFAVLKSLKDRI